MNTNIRQFRPKGNYISNLTEQWRSRGQKPLNAVIYYEITSQEGWISLAIPLKV
jgi:hypothetical protein